MILSNKKPIGPPSFLHKRRSHFFLLLLILSYLKPPIFLYSQGIIEQIELLKKCNNYSLDTSRYQDELIENITNKIDSSIFHTNTNLLNYLAANRAILSRIHVPMVVITHGTNGTDYLIWTIDNYIDSKSYTLSDTFVLMKQLVFDNKTNLFFVLIRKTSNSKIINFIRNNSSLLNDELLTKIINCAVSKHSENILIKILNTFRNKFEFVYSRIITEFGLMNFTGRDSIWNSEKKWFETVFDSSKPLDKHL